MGWNDEFISSCVLRISEKMIKDCTLEEMRLFERIVMMEILAKKIEQNLENSSNTVYYLKATKVADFFTDLSGFYFTEYKESKRHYICRTFERYPDIELIIKEVIPSEHQVRMFNFIIYIIDKYCKGVFPKIEKNINFEFEADKTNIHRKFPTPRGGNSTPSSTPRRRMLSTENEKVPPIKNILQYSSSKEFIPSNSQ